MNSIIYFHKTNKRTLGQKKTTLHNFLFYFFLKKCNSGTRKRLYLKKNLDSIINFTQTYRRTLGQKKIKHYNFRATHDSNQKNNRHVETCIFFQQKNYFPLSRVYNHRIILDANIEQKIV